MLASSASVAALIAAASLCGTAEAAAAARDVAAVQPAGGDQPAAPPADVIPSGVAEVVVTGSTSRRTLLDTSVAITAVNQQQLEQKAPRSTAEVLETIPGVFVEGTAGPVSNNYSVRGLPGGGSTFVRLIEDGMPLIYGGLNDDEVLQYDLSYDRVEAIQGGTSGILTENAAGASINFISRKLNFEEAGGVAKISGADYGDKRADIWYSAPLPMLGKGVAFAASGYIDSTPGVRSSPFTYDTYRFKLQLQKQFEGGGSVGLTYKRFDEKDPYYADQPYSFNNGEIGGVPSLSTQSGNIIGAGFGKIVVPDSVAANEPLRTFSLLNGVHIKGDIYRLDFEKPIGSGVSLFAHLRFTQEKLDFNGVFAGSGTGNGGLTSAVNYLSFTPASPLFNAGYDPRQPLTVVSLQAGRAAFPTATQFGIRSLTTGQIIAASNTAALNGLNGNGLLQQTVLNHQTVKTRDYGSDFGARWNTDGSNWRNSLTVGAMVFNQKQLNDQSGTSTVINDVKNDSNIYDIVALNNAGGVVGTLSNNGLIAYGDWGSGINESQVQSGSIYFNDELVVGDRLHIDLGLRYEHERSTAKNGNSSVLPIPAGIGGIVQVNPNAFNGTYSYAEGTEDPVNYTFGANYTVSSNLSVYARYARSFQTRGVNPDPTGLTLYEGGVTYTGHGVLGTVRGFRTEFDDLQSGGGVVVDNPNLSQGFFADSDTNGVDLDVFYRPNMERLHDFTIHGQLTYQKTEFSNVQTGVININGQNITSQVNAFYNGKTPGRTPDLLFTITPQYDLPHNLGNIYLRYKYIGRIFADDGDQLALPSYGVLSIGGVVNLTKKLTLNVSVDNVTNELGLTEGNPRQGFTQAVVNGYFYGRGIVGTNVLASLSYSF